MFWLLVALSVYAVLVGGVYLLQDIMVFPGARSGRGASVPAVQGVVVDRLQLPSGANVRVALGEPPRPARGVIVFFLGNGEDLRSGVQWAGELTSYDVATVVPEYPGYGDSGGELTVAAFMQAAEAAVALAETKAQQLGVPLTAGGTSLGTFSAIHVAALGRVDRLLLLAPPTSVAEVGARHYWWLPVRTLIRHHFDNLDSAARVHCPALVIHGDDDQLVPIEMGRRVAEVLHAEFMVAPGYGHTGYPLRPQGPFAAKIGEFLVGPP